MSNAIFRGRRWLRGGQLGRAGTMSILVVVGVCLVIGASTTSVPAQDAAPAAVDPAVAPAVDPTADAALRSMARTLAGAKRLSFHAATTESMVDETTGKFMHYMTQRTISLARPDRLRVEEHNSFARHQLWFNAGTLTVHERAANRAAVAEVPATVDGMLDHLFEEHRLTMPVADFLFSDPYESLAPHIEVGYDLGEARAGGRPCRHLAFRQEDLDWQLWIETRGDRALPRKLVITYTNEPGHPQFTIRFSNWDLEPDFPDRYFEPDVPRDAEQVSLATLTGTGRDQEKGDAR